ncbi:MAG TPA: serine protease [Solirubrobacteraceae bacterium]|nr:serine protease [Solirubrobacteraceae bacterium]
MATTAAALQIDPSESNGHRSNTPFARLTGATRSILIRRVCAAGRASEINLGAGSRRSGRRVALGAVLAALLAGCGGQAKTVTGDASAPSLTVAPAATTAVSPVRWPVAARVKRSVLAVFCSDPDTAVNEFVGTGFRVSDGVVTASHVAADCPPGTTFSFGSSGDGGTVSTDPTHDLSLLSYTEYLNPGTDPKPTPLRLESRPAYVGEQLALLGVPAVPLLDPFKRPVTVVIGHVVATNRTQVLTSAEREGARETLPDAILVAVPGIAKGESGGPAINSAGKVVGVIVGSAPGVGIATLTPVTDLASLH